KRGRRFLYYFSVLYVILSKNSFQRGQKKNSEHETPKNFPESGCKGTANIDTEQIFPSFFLQ
ncbi:MAG: hypothetical protein IKX36_05840, partial [Prevotella sp.]|nr:hypothetical protein [Prevotella sp.]